MKEEQGEQGERGSGEEKGGEGAVGRERERER